MEGTRSHLDEYGVHVGGGARGQQPSLKARIVHSFQHIRLWGEAGEVGQGWEAPKGKGWKIPSGGSILNP